MELPPDHPDTDELDIDDVEATGETGNESSDTADDLVHTGVLAVDLITEVELWRRRRGIGFESWRYCVVLEAATNAGSPFDKGIEVLRLLYNSYLAYGSEGNWRKPFRRDALQTTAATIGARLNLKLATTQGILRKLERNGFIRKEMRHSYPYITPDPLRIAAITFPVEIKADEFNRPFPILHFEDAALHHLMMMRPSDIGGCTAVQPINPSINGEVIQARALAQALPELPARAASADDDLHRPALDALPPDRLPSRQDVLGPDNGDHAGSSDPPDSDRGDRAPADGVGRRTEAGEGEGRQPDGEQRSVRDQQGDGERVENAVLPSELLPLDALSALIIGWEGSDFDEDELRRLADEYPFPDRPNPLSEAYQAHYYVMGEHRVDRDREQRVGVAPEHEAAAVRHEVYRRARVRLEEHLVGYYEQQRSKKAMNRALLSVVAYFRTHFDGETRSIAELAQVVNRLVGKLRDQCLADSVAGEVGVCPYYDDGDLRLIQPDVKEAMERESTRWERDESVKERKEAWARERIGELVRLVFNDEGSAEAPQRVRDLYGERARVATQGPYATREGEMQGPRWTLRDEYMNPELLDVWPLLGLRQRGLFGGIAYYDEPH